MSDLEFIVHADDVPEEEGRYAAPFDGEGLSFGKALGQAAGAAALGCWRERLPPGRRTSFTHAHSAEEELVYVLAGTCALRVVEPGAAAREVTLRAGHLVAFRAGTGIAHTFRNDGEADCTLLVVGERRPGVDRVFYPDDAAYDAHLAATDPARHWER